MLGMIYQTYYQRAIIMKNILGYLTSTLVSQTNSLKVCRKVCSSIKKTLY